MSPMFKKGLIYFCALLVVGFAIIRLTDTRFTKRSNGAEIRNAAGADSTTDVAAKAKNNTPPIKGKAVVVKTKYATDDIVIASFNVLDYGAKGDGVTDNTAAFQAAMDKAGKEGGGVVFVPEGHFKFAGTLVIPTGVTLRGDWAKPENAVRGTILEAYGGKGEADGMSFIRMKPSSGVTHLSIWYPEQSLANVAAYPWTIEQLEGASVTISQVTLVNAYQGIKIGPTKNALHYVRQVYGTVLQTGAYLDWTVDIGRIEQVELSADYWSHSGLPGAPSVQDLLQYTTTHTEGIVMGRSDWEFMSNVKLSGVKTGIRLTSRKDNPKESANAQFYNIQIDHTQVALQLDAVNAYGLLISNSSLSSDIGNAPVTVNASSSFTGVVQFNTVRIGGNPKNAVVNAGTGLLSFENSTLSNWRSQTGEYAIVADAGSLILGNVQFTEPHKHVLLQGSFKQLSAVNSGSQGRLDYASSNKDAEVSVNQDDSYVFKSMPTYTATDKAVLPKPSSDKLYDVTAAPYNVDTTGKSDATAAVKQALADAGATGGTVFLPAGLYRINEAISVPKGVELRGAFDVPHQASGVGGTILFTNVGENDAEGTPFITLQAGAGIRGLTIYYDQQNWSQIKPYSWTVQGLDHDVYVINTTLVNPYRAVDFGSYDTSGHYIDYVSGSPLKDGVFVGGGARNGFVRNVQFNPSYYVRATFPNLSPKANSDEVVNYQRNYLSAIRSGHTVNETFFNTFVFGSLYGIHFEKQNGQGSQAIVIGHGTDGSRKSVYLAGASSDGLTFINSELVVIADSDKNFLAVGEGFDSHAVFFNTSMWGRPNYAIDIKSGDITLQQVNIDQSGERGVNAAGGDIKLYDSRFRRSTNIYAGSGITRLVEAGNLFAGGLILQDESNGKVSGTGIKPIK